ncbi:unnamed protein product [Prorocentrum cordatum]|uniref:Uncharacterized protein n=1 Tax=Prorocentrum cordatum TaxID=2364126 RepID=A0ABN9WAT1_9DINO|nr:unnamed protein product [Polarella glacialis]
MLRWPPQKTDGNGAEQKANATILQKPMACCAPPLHTQSSSDKRSRTSPARALPSQEAASGPSQTSVDAEREGCRGSARGRTPGRPGAGRRRDRATTASIPPGGGGGGGGGGEGGAATRIGADGGTSVRQAREAAAGASGRARWKAPSARPGLFAWRRGPVEQGKACT